MSISNTILPHDKDIRVAIDEFICSHTINRNIQLLLENDDACKELYATIFGRLSITSYQERSFITNEPIEYNADTIVWYYLQDQDLLKRGFSKVWLLQSLKNQNKNNPKKAFDTLNNIGQPDFERYGWCDLNQHIDIFSSHLGLKKMIQQRINEAINIHQSDLSCHPFGKLTTTKSSPDYIGRKVLTRSLNNISQDRTKGFFPSQTGHFTTQSIVNGTYRIWDCGLLEMNIVFRLGYVRTDDDGYDILSCNDIIFQQSPTNVDSSTTYQENTKYFYSIDDMKMFQNNDNQKVYESVIGNMKQYNRNNYVNTYFAKLEFPRIIFGTKTVNAFVDRNYMIFNTGLLSQDKQSINKTISQSSNQLTWCDKTRTGVTAILITYPDNNQKDFGASGGLAANSFSCSIIGKWK